MVPADVHPQQARQPLLLLGARPTLGLHKTQPWKPRAQAWAEVCRSGRPWGEEGASFPSPPVPSSQGPLWFLARLAWHKP